MNPSSRFELQLSERSHRFVFVREQLGHLSGGQRAGVIAVLAINAVNQIIAFPANKDFFADGRSQNKFHIVFELGYRSLRTFEVSRLDALQE